jgi:ribokinase
MKKLLVIGSLNMDMVVGLSGIPKTGETVLGKSICYLPGGKGANQAYAVAKLGGQVSMVGAVGNDNYADRLLKNLNSVSVDTSGIKRVNTNTGLAFIYVDSNGRNCIVVLPGANNQVDIQHIDVMQHHIETAEWVILQMEIPHDTVEYVVLKAHSMGKKVLLNPAPAPEGYSDALYRMLDIITPNEMELGKLTSMPVDTIDEIICAANKLFSKGVSSVVVTCGEKGAVLVNSNGTKHFLAKKVKAVDTTAAGDTFTAALAVALSEGKQIDDAIEFANCAATISVTRLGAQSSIPWREEVNEKF